MIAEFLVRLVGGLALTGALIVATLAMWKRGGKGLSFLKPKVAGLAVTDAVALGQAGKLAVVRFGDRELLVAMTRSGTELLAHRRLDDHNA